MNTWAEKGEGQKETGRRGKVEEGEKRKDE
jgi:hypothetical protein